MWRTLATGALAMAALLSVAGCAKQGEASGESELRRTVGAGKITVMMIDHKYQPAEWTVAAGQVVNISVTNLGIAWHDWVLIKKDQAITPPFSEDDEDRVLWKIEANPDENQVRIFTAPSEPGTYQVVCRVWGHIEAGMIATLVVQ